MDTREQCWEPGPSCCVARSPQPVAPISDSKGLLQTSPPRTHSNHWKEVRTHPSFLRGRHGTCILANHTWNSLQRPRPNLFILANGFWKFLKDTSASQVALVIKNLPANAGDIRDAGLIPGSGRSPGEGNGNPLKYSCLESHGQRSLDGYSPWGHNRIKHEWSNLAYRHTHRCYLLNKLFKTLINIT